MPARKTSKNFPKSSICPTCGSVSKYYDCLPRIFRTKYRKTYYKIVPRYRCSICGEIHRKLPNSVLPYKQYEREVVRGVQEGLITPETLGFEDYPCEATMSRWRALQSVSQEFHVL